MEGEVPLNRVGSVLEDLEYPVGKDDAVQAASRVTVRYADGAETLDAIISRSNLEVFESSAVLEAEIMGNVSVGAVGEPGQSEGDA